MILRAIRTLVETCTIVVNAVSCYPSPPLQLSQLGRKLDASELRFLTIIPSRNLCRRVLRIVLR